MIQTEVTMRPIVSVLVIGWLLWLPACASAPEKPKPRLPLPVALSSPKPVLQMTEQGTREYRNAHFEEAKAAFQQAVSGAPKSGQAHYNLGLALYALGETDEAREHFIEAANLEPGNKEIWDSPALRPYGAPDPNIVKKQKEYQGKRPTGGGMGGVR